MGAKKNSTETLKELQKRVMNWVHNCLDEDDLELSDIRRQNQLDIIELLDDNLIDDDELEMPGLSEYRALIFKLSAYEMRLLDLRNTLALGSARHGRHAVMDDIRKHILHLLPKSSKLSRFRSQNACDIVFAVNWDPVAFLEDQKYDAGAGKALSTAVTLTGTTIDAQALSCSQYLSRTWPLRGEVLLSVITDAVCSGDPRSGERSTTSGATYSG